VPAAGPPAASDASPAAEASEGGADAGRSPPHGGAAGRLWVGPPGEPPPAGLVPVVVDPGRAFGTGAHPTTRLCLELLQELAPGSLLDVGCGSGVLSIAAAKLGFAPVSAVDLDAVALEVTKANAAANGVDVAIVVVNTCCVTNEAVAKSRKEASRAARTHRRVYVTGCGANLAAGAFAGLPENVVVVARRSEETPEFVAGDVGAIACVQADARLDRVRAFVKVQDGCSFACRFCVIPLVRGASRSRPAEAVLGEIRRRVAQGHREVVLTGINLGCYRDRAAGYR